MITNIPIFYCYMLRRHRATYRSGNTRPISKHHPYWVISIDWGRAILRECAHNVMTWLKSGRETSPSIGVGALKKRHHPQEVDSVRGILVGASTYMSVETLRLEVWNSIFYNFHIFWKWENSCRISADSFTSNTFSPESEKQMGKASTAVKHASLSFGHFECIHIRLEFCKSVFSYFHTS